jgi:hypothetical protein
MTEGLDTSRLSPSDSATSFRSFARRYRGLFSGFEDDASADALLNRPGAAGSSATELAERAAADLAAASEALRHTLVSDLPEVTLRATPRRGVDLTAPDVALDQVTSEAEALADRIEEADPEDWNRRARVDGHEMSALDLVRRAVANAAADYRDTEQAVEEARRSLP